MATTAQAPSPPAVRPGGTRSTGSFALGWVVAGLALAAALTGLLVPGVHGPVRSTAEAFRGYDLVTAAVIPVLVVATASARRGSLLGQLVTVGLLASILHTSAVHCFGAGTGGLFPLHVAVLATSLAGLVPALADLDLPAVALRFRDWEGGSIVSTLLGVLALSLGVTWLWQGIGLAVTGEVPAGSRLVETEALVRLTMALGLALLVPVYAAAAILVWRRQGGGYVLAAIAVVDGLVLQAGYLVAMPFQAAAGVPGAVWSDPVEPVIGAVYLVGAVLLLRGARAPERTPA